MPAVDSDSAGKLSIMVVDDDTNITLALKLIINSHFQCDTIDTAEDGLEAWQKIQNGKYDLVLSDWNMPRMDGGKLLEMMRADPQTQNIPFLMLTVRRNVESVASAVKTGVNEYIVKPFDKATLIQKLEKLLSRKSLRAVAPSPASASAEPAAESPVDQKSISIKVMTMIGKGEVSLPAMPQVIFTIEEALKKEDTNIQTLSKLIEVDQVISSKLIAVANSVYYRGVKECTMVEDAIMRLGMQETRQLVSLISNRNLFALKDRRYEEIILKLYLHAIASGAAGQSLAKSLQFPDPYNFFSLGLFHDIGKLLVLKVLSDITKDMHGLELTSMLDIMDALHNKAGFVLLSKWGLPQTYSQIALNHQNIAAIENPERELLVVYFANLFTRKLGFSLKEDDGEDILKGKAARLLRINEEIMQKMSEEVTEYVERVTSMM